ncbi:MAG: ABC transporter permease [Bryobacteraceae bacterium]
MNELCMDLRYAARRLMDRPLVTIMAIVTIALGVGLNTAIFSIIDAVMLRPLPYRDSARLVEVGEQHSLPGGRELVGLPLSKLPAYSHVGLLVGPALAIPADFTLTNAGSPIRLHGEEVTPKFFVALGVTPIIGRLFTSTDYGTGAGKVVIISHDLWLSRFNRDAQIIGRTVHLSGLSYVVVGILPPNFISPRQLTTHTHVGVYVPAIFTPDEKANSFAIYPGWFARLRPGITLARARAALTALAQPVGISVTPLADHIAAHVRRSLLILLGATSLVLLIACANVINLLLGWATGRRHEMAVRLALGATRFRLLRYFIIEGTLLATTGSLLGFALAFAAVRLVVSLGTTSIPRLSTATVDWRVLCFTALIAGLCAVFAGVIPGLQLQGVQPGEALRSTERHLSGHTVMQWRNILIACEFALALTLLIGAGLLLKSFVRLTSVPLGFSPEHVLTMSIALPETQYTGNKTVAFFERLSVLALHIPGVTHASFAATLPLSGPGLGTLVATPAKPIVDPRHTNQFADLQIVGPQYLTVLGVSVISGRTFADTDRAGTLPVVIINQELAKQYFPTQNVIGRSLYLGMGAAPRTIVGVVGNVRLDGKSETVRPQVFVPASQAKPALQTAIGTFVVRGTGNPSSLIRALQQQLEKLDKDVPLAHVEKLTDIVTGSTSQRRLQTGLLVTFAAIAVVLAIIGLYGVVSYAVSQRTAEIGIRIALGATPLTIIGMLLIRTVTALGIGMAVGICGAVVLSQTLRTLLFDVGPIDAITYAGAGILLLAIGIIATYIPARKAAKLNASVALRVE